MQTDTCAGAADTELAPPVAWFRERKAEAAARIAAGTHDPAAIRERINAANDAFFAALRYEPVAVARVSDVAIRAGDRLVPARLYEPSAPGRRPAHLFFHGGAFQFGSPHSRFYDSWCREICAGVGCVVLSVNYRLAPEYPFPAGLDDCYAALAWLSTSADAVGVDRTRLSVGGDSSGGNLAAGVCLLARDRGGPQPCLQLLETPYLDWSDPRRFESARCFERGYLLEPEALQAMAKAYLTRPEDGRSCFASPLQAADLTALPAAHVITAEYDPLRDSAELYARRLAAAGVPASTSRQLGHLHGSQQLFPIWAPARAWLDEVIAVLIEFLYGTPARFAA